MMAPMVAVTSSSAPDGPLAIAERFVDRVRAGRDDGAAAAALMRLDAADLTAALSDDHARIAFWLNVYNGAVRSRLLVDPTRYRHRWWFFARPVITVAGRRLSPNAIEHGMLRRSALLVGLGYLHNPFVSAFERGLRVSRPDARIHFALDCGARSCPPLATWSPVTLDADLERATAAYLAAECHRSVDGQELTIPRLLRWYAADFGGDRGVRTLLRRHGIVAEGESPRLRYGEYDWTLDLDGPA
jgi:hypothetical protein